MNAAGASARIFSESFCRPMRLCNTENGIGAPPEKASTSPSRTVPSGSVAHTPERSGNRSVISSSPRDQRKTPPARRTIWARMPSHFHSTSHSAGSPSVSGSSSSCEARKDRKSTRLNSSHLVISYAVFCLKKKKTEPLHLGHHQTYYDEV